MTSTRFMIISDTHNFKFGDAEKVNGQFKHPLPKCDVLLHCGDLTKFGTLSEQKGSLEMLGQIDAELKLVIAGNHDFPLDKKWWAKNGKNTEDPSQTHEEAMELWTGSSAKEAGVTYLEEGLHTFRLKNGSKFKIWTSPYQPEFCNFAFPYERNEDRFNPPGKSLATCIARNPIPDFPGADIIMTHGPPKYILDGTAHGSVGCQHLARAVIRAKPRLHCFGHIHEAYGAKVIKWHDGSEPESAQSERHVTNCYPQALKIPVSLGKETLMVNAAIMNIMYRPTNAPWLIDLDLDLADQPSA